MLGIQHGDIYLMSDKAVGYDWKIRSIPTLRHAAGTGDYLLTNEEKELRKQQRAAERAAKSGSKSPRSNASTGKEEVESQKVKNPLTGRQIVVGKGVFNGLVKKGYVLEDGVMVLKNKKE